MRVKVFIVLFIFATMSLHGFPIVEKKSTELNHIGENGNLQACIKEDSEINDAWNGSFFIQPIIIPDSKSFSGNNPESLNIDDLDHNGFPEIITSWHGYQGGETGLFSYQMNASGNWSKTKLSDIKYFIKMANMSGDENIDILNYSYSGGLGNPCISERNQTGNITDIHQVKDLIYTIARIPLEDVDSDGDRDMIYGSTSLNVRIIRNNGIGNFTREWDEGIADKSKDPSLPNMETRDLAVADINCDGWMDICTAMLCKGSYTTPDYSGYYNWISSGDGNWTKQTRPFPTTQKATNVELADIDADGDVDLGLLTEKSGYLYENREGKEWVVKAFPNYNNHISDFIFDDVDGDGNIDIVTINDVIMSGSLVSIVNVSFGLGNFTWKTVKQFSSSPGGLRAPYLEDMDRDGDKDLIFLSAYGALFSENQMEKRKNMTFTKCPISKHLRSGSLTDFAWTMMDGADIIDTDPIFNLSISYTGEDGPYIELEGSIKVWSNEVIIPDIPSNDVYFKVNWSSYYIVTGPYFIHDSSDMEALIQLKDPKDEGCLISGASNNLTFVTHRHLIGKEVSFYLQTSNSSYSLGKFRIESENNNTLQMKIPSDIFDENCFISTKFNWYSKEVEVDTNSRFNVAPPGELPGSIKFKSNIIPAWKTTTLGIQVLSQTGSDITGMCDLDVASFSNDLDVDNHDGGKIEISSTKTGSYNITIRAERFSISIEEDFIIDVVPNMIFLDIIVYDPEIHVGESFIVTYKAKGPGGTVVTIDDSQVLWSVLADCSFTMIPTGIKIIPYNIGTIEIHATADVGLGEVESNLSINILPIINEIEIKGTDREMTRGESIILSLEVRKYNDKPIDSFAAHWSIGEIGEANSTDTRSIELTALREGTLEVEVSVHFLNETDSTTIWILVKPRPVAIIIDDDLVLEKGMEKELNISVMGSDGNPYSECLLYSVWTSDHNILNVQNIDDKILMIGITEGTVSMEIKAKTLDDIIINESFTVSVIALPCKIELGEFKPILRMGEEMDISFTVFDYSGDPLPEFHLDVESNNCQITTSENNVLHLITCKEGIDTIKITASRLNKSANISFELLIIQNPSEIGIKSTSIISAINGNIDIHLSLLDINEDPIQWTAFQLSFPDPISISGTNCNFTVTCVEPGEYRIEVETDHYGRRLSNYIDIVFYEPAVLANVILNRSSGTGIIEAICFDQNGNNITDKCDLEWSGDIEIITSNKVKGFPGKISLSVIFNNTRMNRSIEISVKEESDTNHDEASSLWWLIPVIILLSGIIGVSVFMVNKRRSMSLKKTRETDETKIIMEDSDENMQGSSIEGNITK